MSYQVTIGGQTPSDQIDSSHPEPTTPSATTNQPEPSSNIGLDTNNNNNNPQKRPEREYTIRRDGNIMFLDEMDPCDNGDPSGQGASTRAARDAAQEITRERREIERRREKKWLGMFQEWPTWRKKHKAHVKERVRKGIPESLRGVFWPLFSDSAQVRKLIHQQFNLDPTPTVASQLTQNQVIAQQLVLTEIEQLGAALTSNMNEKVTRHLHTMQQRSGQNFSNLQDVLEERIMRHGSTPGSPTQGPYYDGKLQSSMSFDERLSFNFSPGLGVGGGGVGAFPINTPSHKDNVNINTRSGTGTTTGGIVTGLGMLPRPEHNAPAYQNERNNNNNNNSLESSLSFHNNLSILQSFQRGGLGSGGNGDNNDFEPSVRHTVLRTITTPRGGVAIDSPSAIHQQHGQQQQQQARQFNFSNNNNNNNNNLQNGGSTTTPRSPVPPPPPPKQQQQQKDNSNNENNNNNTNAIVVPAQQRPKGLPPPPRTRSAPRDDNPSNTELNLNNNDSNTQRHGTNLAIFDNNNNNPNNNNNANVNQQRHNNRNNGGGGGTSGGGGGLPRSPSVAVSIANSLQASDPQYSSSDMSSSFGVGGGSSGTNHYKLDLPGQHGDRYKQINSQNQQQGQGCDNFNYGPPPPLYSKIPSLLQSPQTLDQQHQQQQYTNDINTIGSNLDLLHSKHKNGNNNNNNNPTSPPPLLSINQTNQQQLRPSNDINGGIQPVQPAGKFGIHINVAKPSNTGQKDIFQNNNINNNSPNGHQHQNLLMNQHQHQQQHTGNSGKQSISHTPTAGQTFSHPHQYNDIQKLVIAGNNNNNNNATTATISIDEDYILVSDPMNQVLTLPRTSIISADEHNNNNNNNLNHLNNNNNNNHNNTNSQGTGIIGNGSDVNTPHPPFNHRISVASEYHPTQQQQGPPYLQPSTSYDKPRIHQQQQQQGLPPPIQRVVPIASASVNNETNNHNNNNNNNHNNNNLQNQQNQNQQQPFPSTPSHLANGSQHNHQTVSLVTPSKNQNMRQPPPSVRKGGLNDLNNTNTNATSSTTTRNNNNNNENNYKDDQSIIMSTASTLQENIILNTFTFTLGPDEPVPDDWGLYQRLSRTPCPFDQLITKDATRTFSNHVLFSGQPTSTNTNATNMTQSQTGTIQKTKGRQFLADICRAYCNYDLDLGYCQGISFLVATLLMYMEAEDAFWSLVCLLQHPRYNLRGLFTTGFPLLSEYVHITKELIKRLEPKLYKHLESVDFHYTVCMPQWFMGLYVYTLPISIGLRIWDILFYEGEKILIRTAIYMLTYYKQQLLKGDQNDVLMIMCHDVPKSTTMYTDADKFIDGVNKISITTEEILKLRKEYRQQHGLDDQCNPIKK